jgi:hypothetical protein
LTRADVDAVKGLSIQRLKQSETRQNDFLSFFSTTSTPIGATIFWRSPKFRAANCRNRKCRHDNLEFDPTPKLVYHPAPSCWHISPTGGTWHLQWAVRRGQLNSTFFIFFRHFVFRHCGLQHHITAPSIQSNVTVVKVAKQTIYVGSVVINLTRWQYLHTYVHT